MGLYSPIISSVVTVQSTAVSQPITTSYHQPSDSRRPGDKTLRKQRRTYPKNAASPDLSPASSSQREEIEWLHPVARPRLPAFAAWSLCEKWEVLPLVTGFRQSSAAWRGTLGIQSFPMSLNHITTNVREPNSPTAGLLVSRRRQKNIPWG